MQKTDEEKLEHLLILCVDRDNDIGRKVGVRTPVIGKKENTDAALKLILADPEEADANTMFEAIRIYDSLEKEETSHDLYEVATIAGSEIGGVAADRKLVFELTEVLQYFHANELILVTDGFADEDIMPLVQSRVPVTSVRRVVVKHSEAIEETAAIFSRYLKMLVENPKYSKIALGLPGVLLIALATLVLLRVIFQFDIYTWAGIVGLTILGGALLGKGFGLDRKISAFFWQAYHSSVSGIVSSFTLLTGLLLIGISLYQAWSYISARPDLIPAVPIEMGRWIELIPRIVGWMIAKAFTMIIVGVCIIFLGRTIGYLLDRDSRFWRTSAFTVIAAWSWTIFNELSQIILNPSLPSSNLVVAIITGIIVVVASGVTIHFIGKRYQYIFKEKQEEEKEPMEKPGDTNADNRTK